MITEKKRICGMVILVWCMSVFYFIQPVRAAQSYQEVRVSRFGAVGDGVTDDTKAVQKALSYGKNSHTYVIFESGKTYRMQGKVYLYSNTVIDLNGATILDGYEGGVYDDEVRFGNGLRFLNNKESVKKAGYGALSGVTIKNGTFEGANEKAVSGVLFALFHASDILFDSVTFRNCMAGTHVMDLGGCRNVLIRFCNFSGSYIFDKKEQYREMIQIDSAFLKAMPYWSEQSGVAYDGLTCKKIIITDCNFERGKGTHKPNAIGTHTSYVAFNHDIVIQRNVFHGCFSYAVRFPRVRNLTVSGNRFIDEGENNKTSDSFIKIDKTAKNNFLKECKNITIKGNTFESKKKKILTPVNISGFDNKPYTGIEITGNKVKGTYKGKKASVLWKCENVKKCEIRANEGTGKEK